MPAFLTHFSILDKAVAKCAPAIRSLLNTAAPTYRPPRQKYAVAQCAYLGAMGPDWAAYNQEQLRGDPAGTIFDLVHRKKSGVVVANMLFETRRTLTDVLDTRNGIAFALGYMAHIIGDAICHPYVNNIAGEYHNQPIKAIYQASKIGGVNMHMFCEAHMDSYVAGGHYGAGDQMSNGPGDNASNSWSDFLDGLVGAGFAAIGGPAHHGLTDRMKLIVPTYTSAINLTYPGMNATADAFILALSNLFDVLDIVYDMAAAREIFVTTPSLDWWNLDFVEHKQYRDIWYRFDDLCTWAANVLANVLWPAAWTYYHSKMTLADRRKFLDVMRDWNLDTGYATRVYSKDDTIRICYDHSWAVFASQRPPLLGVSALNDRLMDTCERIAELSGDFDRDAKDGEVVARLTQQHIDDRDHIKTYDHDDNDYGIARVKCTLGKIKVTTSACAETFGYTYTTLEEVTIPKGGDRIFEFKTMDTTNDQANRLVVETLARVSRYDIKFLSWDR